MLRSGSQDLFFIIRQVVLEPVFALTGGSDGMEPMCRNKAALVGCKHCHRGTPIGLHFHGPAHLALVSRCLAQYHRRSGTTPALLARHSPRPPAKRSPMTEETLFQLARAKPPAQRAAFLDQACAGDAALRERVEARLQPDREPGVMPAGTGSLADPRHAETVDGPNAVVEP